MNAQFEIHEYTLQPFAPDPDLEYSVDLAAHLAGMSRHDVLVCCKQGLIEPHVDAEHGSYFFDAEALATLQRVAYLRDVCQVNYAGIRIILDLARERDRLRRWVQDLEARA